MQVIEYTTQFFSANLKTLDKATWLGTVWNQIPKEAIKKSWETQISDILTKIYSKPWWRFLRK